jgi:hypothetical protein
VKPGSFPTAPELDVTPELAEAAQSCYPIIRARALAEWVGAGRELTATSVLRPADARQACRDLGIELPPGNLRSATDVPQFMKDWTVALSAGYLLMSGEKHASVVKGLEAMSPQWTVLSWLKAVCAQLGWPAEPCDKCLLVLHELSVADGPLTDDALTEALDHLPEELLIHGAGQPCPDCGEVHEGPTIHEIQALTGISEPGATAGHVAEAVTMLVLFAGGEQHGDATTLTPLGRLLARLIFATYMPDEDADVAELIEALDGLPPSIAADLVQPWLAARGPRQAAGELLKFAAIQSPSQRIAPLAFAKLLGDEAAPVWRAWAQEPGFGAYARMWLESRGEAVEEDLRDQAWLIAESMCQLAEQALPKLVPLIVGKLLESVGDDVGGLLEAMETSGHAAGAALAGIIRAALDDGPFFGDDEGACVYQLKITLKGVSKPPVWRRILVLASTPLEEFHKVILRAMGWYGGHLHLFSTDYEEYGDEGIDEAGYTIEDLLEEEGDRLTYTYDFGDDWEHGIRLEKILDPDPAVTYPVCVTGKGKCPPEDCGGAWAYTELKESGEIDDPDAFHQDRVNARLASAAGIIPVF